MPLSVCLITSSFGIGGAETHVLTLAEALSAQGHRVTVVSAGGVYASRANKPPLLRHVRMPLLQKALAPVCLFRLWRLDRREKFDVVHAHARYPALLCRLLFAPKSVCTAHWVFSTSFPKKLFSFWGKECLAVSHDIAHYLVREYGYPSKRIALTVNGIDVHRFQSGAKAQSGYSVVHCSRMDSDRSAVAFLLIDVVKKIGSAYPFSLTLIGDGNDLTTLKRCAQEANRALGRECIRWIGACTNVEHYLSSADVFVGVSRAALEAMACECAVILAGNEGYLSIFSPEHAKEAERSNFCCRNTALPNADTLAKDLAMLLSESKARLRAAGERNRAYVMRHYSPERMVEDACMAYERVLKKRCVLCGYYGFGNVGDSLMHRSLSFRLKAEGYEKILTLSLRKITLSSLYAIWRRCDFFLGGGNLLQNETSMRSLRFYTWLIRFAKRRGCHVMLLSAGIGKLDARGKRIVQKCLSLCDGIECRTHGDLQAAKELGAKNATLRRDAVFDLSLGISQQTKDIFLLTFRLPRSNEERMQITVFLLRILKHYKKEEILLFAMHPKDVSFIQDLSHRYGVAYETGDCDRFLSFLKQARAVCGNRLHAGICALKLGIPSFLCAEDEKSRFFAEEVAQAAHALQLPSPVTLFHAQTILPFSPPPNKLSILRVCAKLCQTEEHPGG